MKDDGAAMRIPGEGTFQAKTRSMAGASGMSKRQRIKRTTEGHDLGAQRPRQLSLNSIVSKQNKAKHNWKILGSEVKLCESHFKKTSYSSRYNEL